MEEGNLSTSLKEISENIKTQELNASTMTIMAYSNIYVDYLKLYEKFPILDVPVTYTKKKKKPCMKKIKAPYGSIISLRVRNIFRGIVTHPDVVEKEALKKKYLNKEPFTDEERKRVIYYGEEQIKKNNKREKKYDITENLPSEDEKYAMGIEVICSDGYFLNQLTCILSIGDKLLNVMIFDTKYKIAGCKNMGQAQEAIVILWNYMKNIKGSIISVYNNSNLIGYNYPITPKESEGRKTIPEKDESLSEIKEVPPKFIFDIVMTNIDFFIGFPIDRMKLNNLMNDEKYKKWVKMSTYETTDSTNVNIKFYCPTTSPRYKCLYINDSLSNSSGSVSRPSGLFDRMMEYRKKKNGCALLREKIMKGTSVKTVCNNPYIDEKKKLAKKAKEKTSTLLVFESSKTIGSASNYQTIKKVYEFFIDIVHKNRHLVEEKLIEDTNRFNIKERFGVSEGRLL